MKKTYKIVPFDIELAKKIQAGEIEGKIITSSLKNQVRILCYDFNGFYKEYKLVCAITRNEAEYIINYTNDGFTMNSDEGNLVLEIPDNESEKPQFKPFDRVLVRSGNDEKWMCAFFSHITKNPRNLYASTSGYTLQCIPYEGNEYLVGTTDKPKEVC